MNAIQKFIEAEHKYLDLNEIDYKEYEQMVEPLRDVECVVRCKDCKYWQTNTQFCTRWSAPFATQHTSPNWYCADAERKDGETDG